MSSDNRLDLQYGFFVVDERPYCLWDWDIRRRTLDFLESFDSDYYGYIADAHSRNIASGDEALSKESQHAALAIRTAYSQALETLFALLGATIQAPHCVPAWMDVYTNRDLRRIVSKIHHQEPVLTHFSISMSTWSSVSEAILASLSLEDTERQMALKSGFAKLWARFASEFLDNEANKEYNSLKHGLRVRSGGFYLSVGPQERPGEPSSSETMKLLGKSDFGSSYVVSEQISTSSHHLRMKWHSHNWNPEDIAWGLHMTSVSISNIIACLKILNGIPAQEVQFSWPSDLSIFEEPWKRSDHMGITSMRLDRFPIPPELIYDIPKEKILEKYRAGQFAGVRRLLPDSQADANISTDDERAS